MQLAKALETPGPSANISSYCLKCLSGTWHDYRFASPNINMGKTREKYKCKSAGGKDVYNILWFEICSLYIYILYFEQGLGHFRKKWSCRQTSKKWRLTLSCFLSICSAISPTACQTWRETVGPRRVKSGNPQRKQQVHIYIRGKKRRIDLYIHILCF